MSFRPPDKDPPLVESDPTFSLPLVTFEAQPQDASSVSYFYPWLPFPYMLPQGPGQPHDGADAFQPLGSLVHPGDASQYLPPEAVQSADPALDVQAVETPGGGEGGALPFCETCNLGFGRRQEFKRHMEQGHQPRRQCPFNPCAYKWKRPDKIKAHITNKHRSELCPKVFKNRSHAYCFLFLRWLGPKISC
ncbi:hypothetical protein EDB86DRAFT_2397353 [Lactarius hatsudake]|nr:hypothetical protein EDB86DRAFT_2397353 [Lactarius hatsudake]